MTFFVCSSSSSFSLPRIEVSIQILCVCFFLFLFIQFCRFALFSCQFVITHSQHGDTIQVPSSCVSLYLTQSIAWMYCCECVCVCVLVFYKTPNITRDLLCGAFLFFLLSLRFNYVYLLLLLFMRIELNLIPFAFYVLFARRRYFVFFSRLLQYIPLCRFKKASKKSSFCLYHILFYIYRYFVLFIRTLLCKLLFLVGWLVELLCVRSRHGRMLMGT